MGKLFNTFFNCICDYLIIMKAAIRLQNHGCTNHPYWWIVVAANRKNLKGRFIEHVGYWAPRQGVHVQRQIVLNIPRVKYWISCGAVPTHRVHKFLSIWNILPQPWYQQKTEQELAASKKPQSQMTDKQKIKQQRKRKRRERQKLSPVNYHRRESKFKGAQYSTLHKYRVKLRQKIYAAERQNQILRELLLHNEFHKINRINELSGHIVYDDTEQLSRLEGELAKAKSQLALIDKTFKNNTILQKIKVMQEINKLVDKIRQVQKQRHPFRKRNSQAALQSQDITQFQLDKKLEYELVTKKIEKMNQEFAQLEKLHQVVTLEEYANYLMTEFPELDAQTALQSAQELFIARGKTGGTPLTKFQLYHSEEFTKNFKSFSTATKKKHFRRRKTVDGKVVEFKKSVHQLNRQRIAQQKKLRQKQNAQKEQAAAFQKKSPLQQRNILQLKEHVAVLKKVPQPHILPYLLARPDVIVPTNRPVHPFPDFKTYIPEEYYEPISILDLNITSISSLEPKEELDKYHQKRNYTNPSPTKTEKKSKKGSKQKQAVV